MTPTPIQREEAREPQLKKRDLASQLRYCAHALTDLGGKVPDDCLATIGGVSFLLHQIADAQPQWHEFNKDNESTWPERGRYWVALRNGDVSDDEFQAEQTSQYRIWNAFDPRYVTHWMPIEVPGSPQ